jgi:hypothetical protein
MTNRNQQDISNITGGRPAVIAAVAGPWCPSFGGE